MKRRTEQIIYIWLIIIITLFSGCGQNPSGIVNSDEPDTETESEMSLDNETNGAEDNVTESEPESLADQVKTALETLEVWDGSVAESFDGGDGSAENPYQIANGAQLAKLSYDTNSGIDFSRSYFVLTSDILLNDVSQWTYDGKWIFDELLNPDLMAQDAFLEIFRDSRVHEWIPIGLGFYREDNFRGTFDGNGHTVWGLYNDSVWGLNNNFEVYRGSFWELYNNEMYEEPLSSIDNSNSVRINGSVGLFGNLREGTVSNLTVACSWLSTVADDVGTVVGESQGGTTNNCHAVQTIIWSAASHIGGICGEMNTGYGSSSEIIDSSASGLIVGFYNYIRNGSYEKYLEIGGIAGRSISGGCLLYNCYNKCAIQIEAEISQGYSNDRTYYYDLPYLSIGGICGAGESIANCHNDGNITVTAYNKLSAGTTEVPIVQIGGITGSCIGSITDCSSYGDLIYSGDIETAYIGGVAGLLGNWRPARELCKVNVISCYSNTKMYTDASSDNIGGISGFICGEISVANSYYNKESAKKAVAVVIPRVEEFRTKPDDDYPVDSINSRVFTDQIKGLSEEELRDTENYYNWDFEWTWMSDDTVNDGLPILRSLAQYFSR